MLLRLIALITSLLFSAPALFPCSYSVENPNRKNTNVEADFINAVDSDASLDFLKNCYAILPDPNLRHPKVMNNDPILMLAIHRIEKRGNTAVVDWLLSLGADVNITDNDGYTPLLVASQFGHSKLVQKLLAKGADVRARSKEGNSVLHLTWGTNAATVSVLIAAGAELNAQTKDGMTPLSVSAHHGTTDVVRELLRHKPDVNLADKEGMTALMEAARKGHADVVRLLLAAGADKNLRDKSGKTALDWALRSKRVSAIKLLK